jgi:hypothetical protein
MDVVLGFRAASLPFKHEKKNYKNKNLNLVLNLYINSQLSANIKDLINRVPNSSCNYQIGHSIIFPI